MGYRIGYEEAAIGLTEAPDSLRNLAKQRFRWSYGTLQCMWKHKDALLNPRYGWARFRKGEIWWHSRTWIGRFPIDYWAALVTSFALAASARLATGDFGVLGRHVALVIGFGALTLLTNVAAPRYMRWHAHMRRPGSDERGRALPQSNGGASNGKQPLDDAQGRSKLEPNHEANSGSGSA